jgi:predicted small lipoprotein YifL
MRRLLALVITASVLLSLSGCGKAGRPLPPPDSVYPQTYPNRNLTPSSVEQKEGRALPPEWDQQDLQARFTPDGSYIDPSAKVNQETQKPTQPNAQIMGTDPFNKGMGEPTPSPLQPTSPSTSDGESQQ